MKNISVRICLCLAIILIIQACRPKSTVSEMTNEEVNTDYPITIIGNDITTDLNDNTPLYTLSDEFMEDFLLKANEYQGLHVAIPTTFPTEWGVVCVERLPEGKELWLVQSQSREWKYLVITSGYGTQRILDLIPVAVNIAIQKSDILETESWTTHREPDGAFIIDKNYEWIKSVAEATKEDVENQPDSYRRSHSATDKYYINDLSRFDYIAFSDSIPEYNAVIFYYNRNYKPDAWDEQIPMLEAFCEDKNIYYEEVSQGFSQITIRDFKLNEIINVDITPYIGSVDAGMVMMKKNETPKNISFGSYERMQIAIKRYFQLLNLQ